VLSKVEPEYSEEARKAKWQSTVVLSVIVDEFGRPRDVKEALELAPFGITVFPIRPGVVRTKMVESVRTSVPIVQNFLDAGRDVPLEATANLVEYLAFGQGRFAQRTPVHGWRKLGRNAASSGRNPPRAVVFAALR
jgi:NAD(P)-dependent dehydrogenase (short-subunit alcohol dehydrogenase family)